MLKYILICVSLAMILAFSSWLWWRILAAAFRCD
jgi:hypothetical protein